MPSPEPIKKYVAAVKAKSREVAAQLLSESMGAERPSECIKNSVDVLLTPDSLANDAVLTVVASEVAKRKGRNHA